MRKLKKPANVSKAALDLIECMDFPSQPRPTKVKRLTKEQAHLDFHIKKLNADSDKQIVVGEVYTPYIIDTHSEMMLPEDVEVMAHRFLMDHRNGYIDVMHNNKLIKACLIESYIAKANDPDGYTEGAWVAAVKIMDDEHWADIKAGKYNGFSIEAYVYKVSAEVEYDYLPVHYGFVEKNDGHDHVFYVEVDSIGRVIRGVTSHDDGHSHEIKAGTATDFSNDPDVKPHAHRYFLNEL